MSNYYNTSHNEASSELQGSILWGILGSVGQMILKPSHQSMLLSRKNPICCLRRQQKHRNKCFWNSSLTISMVGSPEMDLPLSEIKGFSVGKKVLFTAVTIHSKAGENYVFTGFPIKKLQEWLAQSGVQKL